MIRINLLPFRLARKKENIRRQVTVFFLLIVFTTICLWYGNTLWDGAIEKLNNEISHLNSELKLAQDAADEVDRIKKELDDLERKRQVIEDLKANRKAPVAMLEIMTRLVIEKRMWFTSFADSESTVTIRGIALDNKTVADFMGQLERSGLFSTVNLGNLKQEVYAKELYLKQFDIICTKGLPPQKAVEPKAKAS